MINRTILTITIRRGNHEGNSLTKGFIDILDEAEGIDALTGSFMQTYFVSVYLKDGTSYENEIGRDFITNILNGTFHVAEDC